MRRSKRFLSGKYEKHFGARRLEHVADPQSQYTAGTIKNGSYESRSLSKSSFLVME